MARLKPWCRKDGDDPEKPWRVVVPGFGFGSDTVHEFSTGKAAHAAIAARLALPGSTSTLCGIGYPLYDGIASVPRWSPLWLY